MSGIFGIIRLSGAPVSDAELAPMAETLKHRGPDGIRYFARDNAGLGHCMLQSTPESLHEVLPFRDEAAGLTITADARIDNREELMATIPTRASAGQVVTDSQLILHAYRKWGEHCVNHLLGDFAFAIWDERAQALFVGRDHMGCKPFYYHCSDGLFVFASSAMAVARVPEVKATLNEGRVADYLVQELEGINKTCSWFNEISRMPPAQCGGFRNNTFNYRQYWTLEPADLSHLKTDEDYLEAFTEVYTEAVRCRLRCQTEPASMLSGGLDSSTIVALARDMLVAEGSAPLRTYSAISDEAVTDCPETACIRAIIAQGNLSPVCLSPGDSIPLGEELLATLAAGEDPFDTGMTVPALMFKVAARDGVRAVLDGIDGDLALGLTSGYPAYLLRDGHWAAAWREARGMSRHYYRGAHSAPLLYLRALRTAMAPDILRRLKRAVLGPAALRRALRKPQLSRQFARRVDLPARCAAYERACGAGFGADLQQAQRSLLCVAYLTAAIERYERVGSCFGVDSRHPLLDRRLLEFAVALPWWQKTRDGWSKRLLRHLAAQRLPHQVAWREGWEHVGWVLTGRLLGEWHHSSRPPQQLQAGEPLSAFVDVRRHQRARGARRHGIGEDQYRFDQWQFACLEQWLAARPGSR